MNIAINKSFYINDFVTPEEHTRKNWRAKELIQRVAKQALVQVACSALLIGMVYPFVATAVFSSLIISAIYSIALSCLFKALASLIIYETQAHSRTSQEYFGIMYSKYLGYSSFGWFDACTRQVLFHEAGHYAAANLFYKNANATIEIFEGGGGVTRYFVRDLTPIGKLVGKEMARGLTALAGPAASLLTILADLSASHYFRHSNPELSNQLLVMAFINTLSISLYALSTFEDHQPGHDFHNIWKFLGIHPLAATIGIIAIPIIAKVAMNHYYP